MSRGRQVWVEINETSIARIAKNKKNRFLPDSHFMPFPSSPFVGRKATLYSGNSALWAQSAATLWEHVPVVTSLVLRSGDPRCDHRWAGMNPSEAKGKKRKGWPLIHWYSLRQRTALWEQDFMLMLLVCTVTMAQHGLLQLTDLTECFEMFWTVSWDCVWGFVRLRPAVECHQLARFPNCSLSMDKPASHVFAIRNNYQSSDQWHAHFSFNLLGCHAATICNGSQGEPVSRPEDSRLPDEKDPFWVGAPLRSVNVSAFESRRRWFTEPSALWMVEVDYYPKNMDDVSGPGFLLIISVLLHMLIGIILDVSCSWGRQQAIPFQVR